jgi:hypothetical protein
MRTEPEPRQDRGVPEDAGGAHVTPLGRPFVAGPGIETDDLVAGSFDQTNGVVAGLDGESDGTIDGENLPAAFRTGAHRPATLWDPHPVVPPPETGEEGEPDARIRPRRPGRRR